MESCYTSSHRLHRTHPTCNKTDDKCLHRSSLILYLWKFELYIVLTRLHKAEYYCTKARFVPFRRHAVCCDYRTSRRRKWNSTWLRQARVMACCGKSRSWRTVFWVPNGSRHPGSRQTSRRAPSYSAPGLDSGRTMWCGARWPVTIGQSDLLWYAFDQYSSCSITSAIYSCPPTTCRMIVQASAGHVVKLREKHAKALHISSYHRWFYRQQDRPKNIMRELLPAFVGL